MLTEFSDALYQQRGISDADRFGQALLSGQTLFLNAHDLPERVRGLGLHGAALLPVTLDNATGVLILGAYRTAPRPWSDFERDLLIAAARTLQVSVQRRHSLRELQQAAHTEPLTGLGNRRAAQDTAQPQLVSARQEDPARLGAAFGKFGIVAVAARRDRDAADVPGA